MRGERTYSKSDLQKYRNTRTEIKERGRQMKRIETEREKTIRERERERMKKMRGGHTQKNEGKRQRERDLVKKKCLRKLVKFRRKKEHINMKYG